PRPEAQAARRQESRPEERQAADVIDMGVAEEEIGVDRAVVREQRLAEEAQPGASIEDEDALADPDLYAGSIAAIADGGRARAGGARPGAGARAATAQEADDDPRSPRHRPALKSHDPRFSYLDGAIFRVEAKMKPRV